MYSRKEACPFLWRIVPLPPEMNSRCVPPSARLKTMSAMRRSTTFLEHLIHLKIATSRCLTNDTTAATLHFIPFYTYLCVKGVGNEAIGWPGYFKKRKAYFCHMCKRGKMKNVVSQTSCWPG